MKNKSTRRGFTLIELLVVVLIIGVLTAVAVSQYQKAVYKSRFTAMMPIAKTIANANEVYYTENGQYASTPAQLSVSAQENAEDGTGITLYSNPEELSFVLAHNDNVPNIRYVVYQKFSANFPDTAWCEAGDEKAEDLCVSLGGIIPEGVTGNSSGQEDNWKAYLLSGQAQAGDTFASTGGGDDTNTEENASSSSTEESLPSIQEVAAQICAGFSPANCIVTDTTITTRACNTSITYKNENGEVLNEQGCVNSYYDQKGDLVEITNTVCPNNHGNLQTNTCIASSKGEFEKTYTEDGRLLERKTCQYVTDNTCAYLQTYQYNPDGSYTQQDRRCGYVVDHIIYYSKCVNSSSYYSANDYTYDSHGTNIGYFTCDTSTLDASMGECSNYTSGLKLNVKYKADGSYDYVQLKCTEWENKECTGGWKYADRNCSQGYNAETLTCN